VFDIVIKNGLYFDGTGAPGAPRHVGIRDGRVAAVSESPLDETGCTNVIDAEHRWVMPGFLEMHSHYDAEVIAAPALRESVRHGVTTVSIGTCSLSMVMSAPQDCSDLFTRVESVPRERVLPLMRAKKTWTTPREYRAFYEQHNLGPNVCSFMGHSDLRVAAMGLDRATSDVRPTEAELQKMEAALEAALDEGLLGLSVMTTRIDKMDGDLAWSRPLPSTFARWREFGRLFGILRRRHAVLQGAPDSVGKINIFAFLWHAIGGFRHALRTTLLTAMDLKSQPSLHWLTRTSAWIANVILRANFRWQALPAPMRMYIDGMDLINFEEFTGGAILRDMKNKDEQYDKVSDPEFRVQFKRDMKKALDTGLWHRNFSDAFVVACPDASMVGRNFGEIGKAQGKDGVDAFFDLCIEHRDKLRWTTLMGNGRVHIMRKLLSSPQTQIGFADSGAHIRNLSFYNFSLRLLKYVVDAQTEGAPFMELGRAVHRITGELADWFGVDAGRIKVGDRADVVIVNPAGLDESLDRVQEAEMENLGLMRLVNRNDAAVEATIINGRIAYRRGDGFSADFGKTRRYGRFLTAQHTLREASPITLVEQPKFAAANL
jgi:N-acyl-D-aspartate/D-glutamate deacylase